MLKLHKTPTCFVRQYDHPQGVVQALLKLPQCTINMYAYIGDVEACIRYYVMPLSPCRYVFLAVMSDTVIWLRSRGLVSYMEF